MKSQVFYQWLFVIKINGIGAHIRHDFFPAHFVFARFLIPRQTNICALILITMDFHKLSTLGDIIINIAIQSNAPYVSLKMQWFYSPIN